MKRSIALSLALVAVALPAPANADRMPWRGIVEGPYGRPWAHTERVDVLRWMGRHRMNAYVHAPKDDLYQRTNWRDPYPADEMGDFEREIRLARRRGIEWIPSLSPAQPLIPTPAAPTAAPSRDLCFSCPADLAVVVEKLRPFLAAGSRTVMISFDDVSKLGTHPEDLAAYRGGDHGFGVANGDFLTRLREELRGNWPATRVLTVGADYSGTADTEYLRGLRSTLAPGIEVMWTGTAIPSEHWSANDAASYAEAIGRRPVVWENWTNNDTAGNAVQAVGAARIFLGPYLREADAAGAVRGFFFNPANEAYLNLLPLATAADWMRDPERYRARASWRAAVRELAPGHHRRDRRRRASLRAWAEASWSNKLDREREAPSFVRKSDRLLSRYEAGAGWPRPLARLLRELRLVQAAPRRLAKLPEPGIARQGADFLSAAAATALSGDLAAQLLAAERPNLELRNHRRVKGSAAAPDPERAAELRRRVDEAATAAAADSEFTYGWRTPAAFEIPPYAVPGNVMDAFVDRVKELDSAWQAEAGEASSSVTLTLDGTPVVLENGHFALGRHACGKLVATDGAGGRTALRVQCR